MGSTFYALACGWRHSIYSSHTRIWRTRYRNNFLRSSRHYSHTFNLLLSDTAKGDLRNDVNSKLKAQVAEADENYAESRRQLEQALSIRNEADAYKEKAVGSAEKQAQELLRAATHAVEVECARLKKQASLEAYQLLAQAEAMRGVAQEELEAQNIYAEAAMLKVDPHEALGELQARLENSEDALEDAFAEEETSDEAKDESNDGPVAEINVILESVGQNSNGANGSGNNSAVPTQLESPSSGKTQAATDAASSKPRSKASRAKAA